MQSSPTVRIFFSSPGDVKMERETARRIVERLQAEVGSRAVLHPYFWEHEVMVATKDYQQNIPALDGFDVVVCVLWSRLGSPLHPERHKRPGGGFFESGTEYEFFMAMQAHQQKGSPDVYVFRNRTEPRRPSRPKEAREAVDREVDRLDQFFDRYFKDGDYFTGAVNSYRTLGEFEDKLTTALHGFLDQHLPASVGTRKRAGSSYAGRPYLGLQAFEFDDAPVFFGRTAQVGEVVEAFQTQELESRATGEEGRRFVLVLGASGSGKSSLARAGVLPMLVQPGVIEGAQVWKRAIFKPGAAGGDPFHALAQALLAPEALPELGADGTDAATLAGLLKRMPGGAGLMLRQALSQAGAAARASEEQQLKARLRQFESDQREEDARELKERLTQLSAPSVRLALLADQLEELFTTEQPAEVTAAFIESLAALAASGRVFVLGTLRSDFYARCLSFPRLVELMRGSGSYALPAPGPGELGQMIRQPAAAAGLVFEENTTTGEKLDELLRDAALRDPAALPLLSYTLEQLHERRTADGVLTLAAYRELGGLEGAIGRRAEAVFLSLSPDAQSAFDGVVRQLVTLGEGGAPVRRRAPHRAVGAAPGASALVEALVKARLFTADQGSDGERSITVAHEALLRHWPRVVKWVEENRDFLRARSRLATRFAEWVEQKRTEHYLIPAGPALGEAESILARHQDALDAEEVDYVRRSTARARAREQQRLRRSRLVAAGAVVLTILALIGGAIAWRERGIAQGERATALVQKSAADESARIARDSQLLAEQKAREARASQARAAYLLGIERLESGHTRDGLTSLAQALTLDPTHVGARNRLYSYQLYGLPKAISLRSQVGPEGARQRISGAGLGPVQRCAGLDARGAAEVFDLATRQVVQGPWTAKARVRVPFLNRTSSHLLLVYDNGAKEGITDIRCSVWAVDQGTSGLEIQIDPVSTCIDVSDDGRWLVEGCLDGRVHVWDAAGGTLAFEWKQGGRVDSIDCDARSSLVVTSGDEYVFFDLGAGVEVSRSQDVSWLARDVRFARESSVCVIKQESRAGASANTRFVFVSGGTGAPIVGARTIPIDRQVFDFALNEEGTELAVAAFTASALVFDRQDAARDRSFEHATYPQLVRFSPDSRLLVTATSDGTVRIWDAATGLDPSKRPGVLAFEPISHDGRLEDLVVSWDGRYLLSSTSLNARVWDLSVGRALTLPLQRKGSGFAARFDDARNALWIASGRSGLQAFDASSLEAVGPAFFEGSSLISVLVDENCKRAAALMSDGGIEFVDLEASRVSGRIDAGPAVTDWGLSGSGSVLVVVRDSKLSFFDARSVAPLANADFDLPASEEYVRLNFDGTRAAVIHSGGVLDLRDVAGRQDTRLDTAATRIERLFFSPDGRWLAGSGVGTGMAIQNSTLIWDVLDPRAPPRVCSHGDSVYDLCFSPDSSWIATGTRDQVAQVWSVSTGRAASAPLLHADVVRKVAFSPDSTLLATDCGDGTVRVFDWREALPVSQALEVSGNVTELTFTADGGRLAAVTVAENADAPTVGPDSSVRVFEVLPPTGLPLALVALTEAATAQRVSASDLAIACDPSEGWRMLREAALDSWFLKPPADRSISPAFTASSRRWINDGSITLAKTSLSMPAVGEVRAALSHWTQNEVVRRGKALEKQRVERQMHAHQVHSLAVFSRPWNTLQSRVAVLGTRWPRIFVLVRYTALAHWNRTLVDLETRLSKRLSDIDLEISQQAANVTELERQVAALVKSAARVAKDDFRACLSLSLQAESAGDLPSARKHIDRARELAPDDREVLNQASDVYLGMRDVEAEFAVLTRLRALEPDVMKHRNRMGFNCWRRGDRNCARLEFTALVDDPDTQPVDRSNMLILLGRTKEALAYWSAEAERETASGGANSADVIAMQAICHELERNSDAAVALYVRLIAARPESADRDWVQSRGLLPDIQEAISAVFERTLQRHPELRPKGN